MTCMVDAHGGTWYRAGVEYEHTRREDGDLLVVDGRTYVLRRLTRILDQTHQSLNPLPRVLMVGWRLDPLDALVN